MHFLSEAGPETFAFPRPEEYNVARLKKVKPGALRETFFAGLPETERVFYVPF